MPFQFASYRRCRVLVLQELHAIHRVYFSGVMFWLCRAASPRMLAVRMASADCVYSTRNGVVNEWHTMVVICHCGYGSDLSCLSCRPACCA